MNTWDVVVIGSGIAGTSAALAAAARGAAVALVQWKPGASALSNGSWTGPIPVGLSEALHGAGYEIARAPAPLYSPDGSRLGADAAAATHTAELEAGPLLVCGIAGLPFFHARSLARLWTEQGERELQAAEIALAGTPAAGWAPAALCAEVGADVTILAGALRTAVLQAGSRGVVLPAILGFEQPTRLRATLEHIIGCRVIEALGSIPSIPGWRLQRALRIALEQAGVTVLAGQVRSPAAQGAALRAVALQDGARMSELRARSFVLATGKFTGGGIEADRELRETTLDLPVWIDYLGERFQQVEPLNLTDADRHDDQPLLNAGVSVDADGRPADQSGDLIYENVWTAGAVRRGNSGSLGRAAAEGWAAGERAAA